MKKVLGFLIVFTLIVSSLVAKDFIFEVTPVYNLQNGVLNEYVIYNNLEKESELNWDIRNSSSIGLSTTFGCLFLDYSFYFAQTIPYGSGKLYDSDWLNTNDYSMKTNFSISDNTIQSGYDMAIKIAAHITPTYWLTIKPFTKLSYNSFRFESSNSEGWYGDLGSMVKYKGLNTIVSWDDENAAHFTKGQLGSIKYERTTLNIYLGIDFYFTILNRVNIFSSISAAPYNYIDSLDIHWKPSDIMNSYMYNDRIEGLFNYYSASLGCEYLFNKNISIGIKCDYTYMNFMLGKTWQKSVSEYKYPVKPNNLSAASGYLINTSLYASFRF